MFFDYEYITSLSFDAPTRLLGTPSNIRMNLILPETRVTGLFFFVESVHSYFRDGLRKTHVNNDPLTVSSLRSSKVIDFGTNRKHICDFNDFIVDLNDNLNTAILPPFRDIRAFVRRKPLFPHPTSILDLI